MFDPLLQQSAHPVVLPALYWPIGFTIGLLAVPACVSAAVVLLTHRRLDLGKAVVPERTREMLDFLRSSRRLREDDDQRTRRKSA